MPFFLVVLDVVVFSTVESSLVPFRICKKKSLIRNILLIYARCLARYVCSKDPPKNALVRFIIQDVEHFCMYTCIFYSS